MNGALQRRTVISDSTGSFKVTNLDPTLYKLSVSLPGYATIPPTRNEPLVYYRIGENVRLEMVRGGVITGTVTNATGEPVIAVPVRAM
jgi:hypothetical protein